MTQVTRIDRSNIRTMRSEVEQALAAVGAKYGLDFNVGRITFAADNFRAKVTATVKSSVPTGVTVTPGRSIDAVALANYGRGVLGLSVADLAKSYQYAGIGHKGPVKLVGYTPRRYKYPFSVQTARGARYKITANAARELVKNPVAA